MRLIIAIQIWRKWVDGWMPSHAKLTCLFGQWGKIDLGEWWWININSLRCYSTFTCALLHTGPLLEEVNPSSGTWYTAIDLVYAFILYKFIKNTRSCLLLLGRANNIHIEYPLFKVIETKNISHISFFQILK